MHRIWCQDGSEFHAIYLIDNILDFLLIEDGLDEETDVNMNRMKNIRIQESIHIMYSY